MNDDNKEDFDAELEKLKQRDEEMKEYIKYLVNDCKPQIVIKTPEIPKDYQEMLKMKQIQQEQQMQLINCNVLSQIKVKIENMNEEQLDIYEKKLKQQLNNVHTHQQKLYYEKIQCIVCKQKERNVVFDACNHLVICIDCQRKSTNNICPACLTEYNEIFIINL